MSTHGTPEEEYRLSDGSTLDPLVAKILAQRNIKGQAAVSRFLEPKLLDLPDPFLMKDMEVAVKIIADGIARGLKILIVGDYDVDGTSATALLLLFFNKIGCAADYYIPNRLTEGYGLQAEGLKRISKEPENKEKILITVDNGISAHDAVILAKELGYRCIITDHHTPPAERVAADAVLNPKQAECQFPDKNLAGVGLAFYLAMGVRNNLDKSGYFSGSRSVPNLKQLLDLVALGTVADMVPLVGVNRTLVKAGVEIMALAKNPGITALCRQTNLDCSFICSEDISFQLAPKINAAGRLGLADKAVQLFISDSKSDAMLLSSELVGYNERRKNISLDNFHDAKDELKSLRNLQSNGTVVAGEYHLGVAGIVASNLVEEYGKPSVVLCAQEDGGFKGSARSVPGVDLYLALSDCRTVLSRFGGHPMAGGLSLDKDNLQKFKQLFDEAVYRQNQGRIEEKDDQVDADIEINRLFSGATLRQLHYLEPFGQDNPQPLFRDRVSSFREVSPIGKDKNHLRLSFSNGKTAIKGVAFGLGKLAEECRGRSEKEILYTPSINFFRGRRSWQVRVTKITFTQDNIPA